jgi:uncharacterized protein
MLQITEESMATTKMANSSLPVLPLDASRPQKTLDFGGDGLVCSVGLLGDIISLSTYHSEHGMVTVNPFEQFPGDRFWDSGFVRGYRKKFLQYFEDLGSGFGLRVYGDVNGVTVGLIDGKWPRINYRVGAVKVESSFFVLTGPESGIVNTLTVVNESSRNEMVDIGFGGKLSVNRASYGQLTEAGPIPIPPCLNQLRERNDALTIHNPNLPATFGSSLYLDGQQVHLNVPTLDSSDPISFSAPQQVVVEPRSRCQFTVLYRLESGPVNLTFPRSLESKYFAPPAQFPTFTCNETRTIEKFVIQRTLDYIVSCCCIPIEDGAVCVLTDHIALPLGWHRDN